MKFEGYHTVLRNPAHPDLTGDHRDLRFMASKCDPLSPEGQEPLCPLAAVGRTMVDMSRVEMNAFMAGHLVIDVINVASQQIETYDWDRQTYELDLEYMAG